MSSFTPQQHEAIHTIDCNLAVSAGAGAGKTRVLVERYIHILAEGKATCDEIVAITFTNKAAKEMKERIRAKLDVLIDTAVRSDKRKEWQEFKHRLEYAPISTIHSLCTRILRENPVEAMLDPRFVVLEDVEATLLLDTAVQKVLEQAMESDDELFDAIMQAYGKTSVAAILNQLYNQLDGRDFVRGNLGEQLMLPYRQSVAGSDDIRRELTAACIELMAYRPQLNSKTSHYQMIESLCRHWEEIREAIGQLAGDNEEAAVRIVERFLVPLQRRNKDKDIVKTVQDALQRLRQISTDRKALRLLPGICALLEAVHQEAGQQKKARHALTFNDLEWRTAQLLTECPAVCQRYVSRFRYLMVDEFQDTNDLQRQIVYLLAGGDAGKLYGRKLFIVGDEKQSIYRFRGADVSVFKRVAGEIAATGGKQISLGVNFRSADGLLAMFNDYFEVLMGTDEDARHGVAFSRLAAHRCYPQAAQRVEIMAIDKTRLPERLETRAAEATAIAQRIRAMVDNREMLVYADNQPQPVRFGDIAILFRALSDVETYEAALQAAGIPYYILGGRSFYGRQEIMDVLNMVKVIENCYDETALAGVLRSPMFMLSDETLLWLKNAGQGGLWPGLTGGGAIAELSLQQRDAAVRARRVLDKLRSVRRYVKVSDMLAEIISQTEYDSFVLTQFMGQQKYANLQKLVALAREFESQDFHTLGDFLRHIQKLMAEDVREGEAQIESEIGNTVKIMTIHRSKGLEYPVVFIPDLQREFTRETGTVIYSRETGLGMKLPDEDGNWLVTTPYEMIANRENLLAMMEMKRLLYVAVTRAMDYLVLSGSGDKFSVDKTFGELNTWLKWCSKIYGFARIADMPEQAAPGVLMTVAEACEAGAQYSEQACSPVPSAAGPPTAREILKQIQPAGGQERSIVAGLSASVINRFRQCPRMFYYSYYAGLPETAPACRRSTALSAPGPLVGLAVHKFCELFEAGLAVQPCLQKAVDLTVPLPYRQEVCQAAFPLVNQYVNSDFYRLVAQYPAQREWQFGYTFTDDRPGEPCSYFFNGIVDRLIFHPDHTIEIIDYKTDRMDAAAATEKAADYVWQLSLYTLAVEAAFSLPVRSASLYFVRPDTVVQVPIGKEGLAQVTAEVLQACRFVIDHRDERDYRCCLAGCTYCGYRLLCTG